MSVLRKEEIFISSYLDEDEQGRPLYAEPFSVKGLIAPTTGSRDIYQYGERAKRMYKMSLPYDYITKIKEGDKAYFYEAKEQVNEAIHGFSANYVVYSVRPYNIKTIVYFELIVPARVGV